MLCSVIDFLFINIPTSFQYILPTNTYYVTAVH